MARPAVHHVVAVGRRSPRAVARHAAEEGAAVEAVLHGGGHLAEVPEELLAPVLRLLAQEGPQRPGRHLMKRDEVHRASAATSLSRNWRSRSWSLADRRTNSRPTR